MKVTLCLLLLSPILLLAQTQPPAGNSVQLVSQGARLYPIEKGFIRYEVEGQPTDTLVFVFDRFGWRQVWAEFGLKTYYSMKTPVNTREIVDGLMTYTLNLKDKKGTYSSGHPVAKMASYKGSDELIAAYMAHIGASRVDKEVSFLDRSCQVWAYTDKGSSFEIWTWQGLILRKETAKGCMNAINIDLSSLVKEDWLILPSDIAWQN